MDKYLSGMSGEKRQKDNLGGTFKRGFKSVLKKRNISVIKKPSWDLFILFGTMEFRLFGLICSRFSNGCIGKVGKAFHLDKSKDGRKGTLCQ